VSSLTTKSKQKKIIQIETRTIGNSFKNVSSLSKGRTRAKWLDYELQVVNEVLLRTEQDISTRNSNNTKQQNTQTKV
jgi:hypothetical protein